MTAREAEIIELIRKEVKPALGCTEPIAVALAVAKAMEIMEYRCGFTDRSWRMKDGFSLRIEVSGNILKNGMGVGIPGTGMVGLHIAAALGAVCGRSEYGLEVLNDLDETSISRAKALTEDDLVKVGLAETDHKLYVKAYVDLNGHSSYAVIEDNHDSIVETGYDGETLTSGHSSEGDDSADQKTTLDYKLTVKEILDFASTVAFEDISFILESRTLNLALAKVVRLGPVLEPCELQIEIAYAVTQKYQLESVVLLGTDGLETQRLVIELKAAFQIQNVEIEVYKFEHWLASLQIFLCFDFKRLFPNGQGGSGWAYI